MPKSCDTRGHRHLLAATGGVLLERVSTCALKFYVCQEVEYQSIQTIDNGQYAQSHFSVVDIPANMVIFLKDIYIKPEIRLVDTIHRPQFPMPKSSLL